MKTRGYLLQYNNNIPVVICKAHKVSSNAESEAPAVAIGGQHIGIGVATIGRVSLSSASSDLLRVDRGIEANDSRTSGPSFLVEVCVGPWKRQL